MVKRPIRRELVVPVDTARLAEVRRAASETALAAGFDEAEARLIALAVDDAVTNVIRHSYRAAEHPEAQWVEVTLSADDERLEVLVRDTGAAIDLGRVPQFVDINEHVRRGRRGGLGIFLMRRIMDEVNYLFRRGEQNELRMVKYIDRSRRTAKNDSA